MNTQVPHPRQDDHIGEAVPCVARFVARHGGEALEAVLEKVDDFLADNKIQALDSMLLAAPIFGDLLRTSRKNFRDAIEAIIEGDGMWMLVTHNPASGGDIRERIDVRTCVGNTGRIILDVDPETVGLSRHQQDASRRQQRRGA